jgi:hypothetical protein
MRRLIAGEQARELRAQRRPGFRPLAHQVVEARAGAGRSRRGCRAGAQTRDARDVEDLIADRDADATRLRAAAASINPVRQVLNGKLGVAIGALDKTAARRIVGFVGRHGYTRKRPPSQTIFTPVLVLR